MSPADLPDDALVPMRFVRQHFIPKDATARDMTTQELAVELGHSADWWRTKAPQIDGAYRDSAKSPWYIPRQQAIAFLDAYKASKTARRGRPKAVPPRSLVGGRFKAVGRQPAYAYKS